MADDRRGGPRDDGRHPHGTRHSRAGRPFDLWLDRQLQVMYGDIAQEPLPGDVLGLIERARSGRQDRAETGMDVTRPHVRPRIRR